MALPERSLAVVQQPQLPSITFDEKKLQVIKNTVAKGSTDDEFQMFIHLCQRYGLDPFLKEIWFIKRVKKKQYNKVWDYPRLQDGSIDYRGAETIIMTSRDGYLKVAQQDADFEGIKSFVVKEGDTFEIDAQTDAVTHKFGLKRGAILGAWAVAYHKKRRPAVCFVDYSEYKGSGNVWEKYPSAMIQKVAEVFVLKRQFGISGLVTQEEMNIPQETSAPDIPAPEPRVDDRPLQHNPEMVAPEQPQVDEVERKRRFLQMMEKIKRAALVAGYDEDRVGAEIRKAGSKLFGKEKPNTWSYDECKQVLSHFEQLNWMGTNSNPGISPDETFPFEEGYEPGGDE